MTGGNRNVAPYPHELAELVAVLRFRPGWSFSLGEIDRGQGSLGLTLDIWTQVYDTNDVEAGETYRVHHYIPVPPAAYNRRTWQRWLLRQCMKVEFHEACEFFMIDGVRPFAPPHGLGEDPYLIGEVM